MQIKSFLNNLIFGKPRTEIAKYRTPAQIQELEKKVMQLNAQLTAANLRMKAEDEERKRREVDEKTEEREKQYILEQKTRMAHLKMSRSLTLPIFGMAGLPTFFLKSNVPYKKFAGFFLRQTEDGQTLWAPLLTDGKTQSVPSGPDAWTDNPINIFRSGLGMVTQLRGGKVDSNYDIIMDENTGKDMLILRVPKYRYKGKDVKVLDISESERLRYDRELDGLMQKNKIAYADNTRTHQIVIDQETELNRMESKVKKHKKESETYKVQMESANAEYNEVLKRATSSETAMTEIKAQQVQTEKLAWSLLKALKTNRGILERDLGKSAVDMVVRRFENFLKTKELGIEKPSAVKPSAPPVAKPVPAGAK